MFLSAFPPHINLLNFFDIESTKKLAFLFEAPACGRGKVCERVHVVSMQIVRGDQHDSLRVPNHPSPRGEGPQPLHNLDKHCRVHGRELHVFAYLALPRSPAHILFRLFARTEARIHHHLSASHAAMGQTHSCTHVTCMYAHTHNTLCLRHFCKRAMHMRWKLTFWQGTSAPKP
jgi:hypothetical protein